MLMPIRTGEPAVMSFIKRAKILATRVYEFFEGGNIDTIANSPDKFVWRTNRTTSDLRKSSIHQASGEFVVHTRTVAPRALAAVRGELPSQTLASCPKSHHPSDGYVARSRVQWCYGLMVKRQASGLSSPLDGSAAPLKGCSSVCKSESIECFVQLIFGCFVVLIN